MQRCRLCGLEKRLTEFPRNGRDKRGHTRYRAQCKICYNINRKLDKGKVKKFVNNTKHRTGEVTDYTFVDWRDTLVHFEECCAYCGRQQSRRLKLTRDHVVPVSKGGLTTQANIIPACKRCNGSKGAKTLDEWYVHQQYYKEERGEEILKWIRANI